MTGNLHELRAELVVAVNIRTELPWRLVDPILWPRDRAVQARASVDDCQVSAWRAVGSPSWDWLVWGPGGVVAASDTTRAYTAAGALYAAGQALYVSRRIARPSLADIARGRAA